MVLPRILLSAVSLSSLIPLTFAATCFYPDGITTEPNHQPCNTTVANSACCDPLDSCSASGICLGRTGFNYRGSCTDRTWGSDDCPTKFCLGDPFNDQAYSEFTPLWPCDPPGAPSNRYCCNSPTRNCCNIATFNLGSTGFAFKGGMDLLLQEIANSSAAPATITVTATATATSVAPVAQTGNSNSSTDIKAASSSSSSSSNLGPAIGLGLGLPLGLLAIGILSFLFWRERKHSRAEAEARTKVLEMDPGHSYYAQETYKPSYSAPGPPPVPPRSQVSDEGTSNSQISTLPARPQAALKSPGIANGPTGVHELI